MQKKKHIAAFIFYTASKRKVLIAAKRFWWQELKRLIFGSDSFTFGSYNLVQTQRSTLTQHFVCVQQQRLEHCYSFFVLHNKNWKRLVKRL